MLVYFRYERGFMNIKNNLKIISFFILAIFFVILFVLCIDVSDKSSLEKYSNDVPRIGEKLWTYNIKNHAWRNYSQQDYELDTNKEIILKIQQNQQNSEVTAYNIITDASDISVSDLFLSEGSREFLFGTKLYSYFPRTFEYFEIIFNGFNFTLRKLSTDEIAKLFNDYQIIKLSDFKNYKLDIKYTKDKQKYIILNDSNKNFNMYYIIPAKQDGIKIENFSNQFKVLTSGKIQLQRIEGCTKSYPCYEINFVKE